MHDVDEVALHEVKIHYFTQTLQLSQKWCHNSNSKILTQHNRDFAYE